VVRRPHSLRSPLAAAVGLVAAACSGTLPGLGPEESAPGMSRPGVASRTVRNDDYRSQRPTQRALEPVPEPAAAAPVAPAAPAAAAPFAPATNYSSETRPAPPLETPAPPSPSDVRDRQFEMLTEAVAALRQELARSYEHSQALTQENEKLRALVASLRRELNRGKGANKVLRDHLQSLEKRMRELEPPPLAQPRAATPAAQAPATPSVPSGAAPAAAPPAGGAADTAPAAESGG
jgi:translation initiation factor IF-2